MAKLPITLEAGTADKKLAYTDNIYDKLQEKFQSEINEQLSLDVYDLNNYHEATETKLEEQQAEINTIKANNWVTTNRISNKAVTQDKLSQDLQNKLAALTDAASGGMHFVGVTSTALTDGATTATLTPLTANSMIRTTGFLTGDIVVYGKKEFIWGSDKWIEFGDMSGLGTLASKNSASGTVSGVPTSNHTHSVGAYTHTVTQGTVAASGTYTPEGTVSVTNKGNLGTMTESGNGGFVETDEPKRIGDGDKILTNQETENVTIKGVGGTTTVKNVTNVGTLPTYEAKSIPNVTSAGTMFKAEVVGETLKLTAGTSPTLGAAISVNSMKSAGTLPSVSNVTVATAGTDKTFKAVYLDEWYDPANNHPTIADHVDVSFAGKSKSISVSGTTSGVAVSDHAQKNTGGPSATENKTVTVS